MQVLDFSPMKESRRTLVKVLMRKGMWSLFFPSDRMHSYKQRKRELKIRTIYSRNMISWTWTLLLLEHLRKIYSTFRASRLRLISAVSTKVLRSLLLTSVPRSLPAKSTSENLPCSVEVRSLRRRTIWRTAWEREELALAEVWPDVLGREEKYWYFSMRWFHPREHTHINYCTRVRAHTQTHMHTHTVCADRHTCRHCLAVSSLWLLLPWTHTSPPGPQPEPVGAHLPGLEAWPSCSGGRKPESKHNHPFAWGINYSAKVMLHMNPSVNSSGKQTSYFSIVYFKEADIDRQIQVWKPPVVEECKNLLGLRRNEKSIYDHTTVLNIKPLYFLLKKWLHYLQRHKFLYCCSAVSLWSRLPSSRGKNGQSTYD